MVGFAALYVALLLPWPRLGAAYDSLFLGVGQAVFAERSGPRMVWFESAADAAHPQVMNICIASRETFQRDGGGMVRSINMDSRGFGWQPTALILAFFLATPVAWGRRLGGLALALVAFHLFVWAALAFAIWYDSSFVGLIRLTPWQTAAGEALKKAFLTGITFVVPLVCWLVFALRQPGFLVNMKFPFARLAPHR